MDNFCSNIIVLDSNCILHKTNTTYLSNIRLNKDLLCIRFYKLFNGMISSVALLSRLCRKM